MNEHRPAGDDEIDPEAASTGSVPDTPIDPDVVRVSGELPPGTALDLGCGSGQNSIWLGARGWRVHCVDMAKGAIERAEAAAAKAGIDATFEKADVTEWRTKDECDLVVSHGDGVSDLPVVLVVARHPGPPTRGAAE